MAEILANYVNGRWVEGSGPGAALIDPVSGATLARASTEGVDLDAALDYARNVGGPALRSIGYAGRAGFLRGIADVLAANRDKYGEIALANSGNTGRDAAIDIDGAIGTLKYFASVGRSLGDARYLVEPGTERLGRDERLQAAHAWTPLMGVAIHINAFNFPSWGLWEKAAVALLSGMPVLAKPATATAWLAVEMVRDVTAAGILPPGALSIIAGPAHGLLDHVGPTDAVAFTGSGETAAMLRSNPAMVRANPRFNVEADSINVAILGPDAGADSPEFDLFVAEVVREMTQKAGQKCTAIRRALVPAGLMDAAIEAIGAKLAEVKTGDPRRPNVRMGPLVSKAQQLTAFDGVSMLRVEARVVAGGPDATAVDAEDPAAGCFVTPTLLACDDPRAAAAVHEVEIFGPVATVVPYGGMDEAFSLAARGGGALVGSVFTADEGFATEAATALAPSHGRVLVIDRTVAEASPGHGIVMPMCVHGGPGRAGNGEELGGLRGLAFYHRRTAVQAATGLLDTLRGHAAELRP